MIDTVNGLVVLAAFEGVELNYMSSGAQSSWLLAMKDGKVVGGAYMILIVDQHKIPGAEEDDTDWYEVNTVAADNARLGYLLFLSILVHYKNVVPSPHLSPASQSIIKRWYDRYDDTEYVVDGLTGVKGPFGAGYHNPGLQAPLPVKHREFSQELRDEYNELFLQAFSSRTRSRTSDLSLLLKLKDSYHIYDVIQRAVGLMQPRLKSDETQKVKKWVSENAAAIEPLIRKYIVNEPREEKQELMEFFPELQP